MKSLKITKKPYVVFRDTDLGQGHFMAIYALLKGAKDENGD
ncbi:hypothetical protein [Dyadobacter sp. 50-39]|nr:hypothetical protein [Dyadobacter sp. 50-39]